MLYKSGLAALLAPLALAGCATASTPQPIDLATATIVNADGQTIGAAVLSRSGGAIAVRATITGAPGASHGLHLHAVGRCEAPFTSAGPHLNPTQRQHGKDNPMGAHMGDLPNVAIDQAGKGSASAQLGTDLPTIDAAIFDADGTAIVVHAAADDYKSDPTGNSGARIACGVFKRT